MYVLFTYAARVFVSVIESADVRRRARLLPEAASLLFPPSAASESDPASVVDVDEAYTCEGLRALPHRAMTGCVHVSSCLHLIGRCAAHTCLQSHAFHQGRGGGKGAVVGGRGLGALHQHYGPGGH